MQSLKKRASFLEQLREVASLINKNVFNDTYLTEIFFSGRDEDFAVLSFKKDQLAIEINIELTNHQYLISGQEKVTYQVFSVKNKSYELLDKSNWILKEKHNKEPFKEIANHICQLAKQIEN